MSATSSPRPIRIAEHRSRHGPRPALPDDRPGLVEIGPFAIRWYALAYIPGLLLGWRYVRHLSDLPPPIMTREHVAHLLRSEERRLGKDVVSTCMLRGGAD